MLKFLNTIAGFIDNTQVNAPQQSLENSDIQSVLQLVFGLSGAVALLIMVVSGLRFVFSQGDPNSITKARNSLIYALIGLVICSAGFSIVTFVLGRI